MKAFEMSIRTILYDLGNVLMSFSHERMCEQIAAVFAVSSADVKRVIFDEQLYLQFDHGRLTEEQFHKHLQSAFGATCSIEELRKAAGDIFEPIAEMHLLVDELKAAGLRLVLLSNTCVTHIDWIRSHFDLLEKFEDLVLSYEVGCCKPDVAIFEIAKERIGCRPEECLYTDDIAAYVKVARGLGFRAETFTTPAQFRDDLFRYGVQQM